MALFESSMLSSSVTSNRFSKAHHSASGLTFGKTAKVNRHAFCMPIEATPPRSSTPEPKVQAMQPVWAQPTERETLESLKVEEEYRSDIIQHMAVMEEHTRCDPEMIAMQPELQWHMRPYLLDFLVESHMGLQLSTETLFLAVNIADRYSSKRVVFKRHYQLVGCTALWIASKYSDKKNKVPTLEELKMICCQAYEAHMFTQMELHILSTLEWSVGHPTVDLYLDLCFGKIRPQDMACAQSVRNIALYLCENALYNQELMRFPASVMAKSAFKLGLVMLTMGTAPFKATSVEEAECFDIMGRESTRPTACLERKYSREEYSCAMRYVWDYTEYTQQQYEQQQQQMATPAPTPTRHNYASMTVLGYMTPPVDEVAVEEFPGLTTTSASTTTTNPQNIIVMTTTADMQQGEYEALLEQDTEDESMDDDDDEEDMSTVIYDTECFQYA